MITEQDLIDLGYRIKTRLTDKDHTVDFVHNDFNIRQYLVNLDRGEINIVYPNNLPPREIFITEDINEFRNWHEHYIP